MKTILGSMLSAISGNAIWVLSLINLMWLLVKDHTLFSWWWVIIIAVVFAISFIGVLISAVKNEIIC